MKKRLHKWLREDITRKLLLLILVFSIILAIHATIILVSTNRCLEVDMDLCKTYSPNSTVMVYREIDPACFNKTEPMNKACIKRIYVVCVQDQES